MEIKDNEVRSETHSSEVDTNSTNRAIEKASKDPSFINAAIGLIKEMKFPVYKKDIINQAKRVAPPSTSISSNTTITTDPDTIALFESLNGYIQYRDLYHVQKALEENNPEKKKTSQITDSTREQPTVRTRPTTTADASIKEREAVNKNEERKDYPEVPPSAMSNFVCSKCGKPFQNQNDLIQHQRFEGTEES
jgi:hypothetical protein